MKKYILTVITSAALIPSVTFAAVTNATTLFSLIKTTLNSIMPIIVSLAVLYFIYGVLTFIMNAGDEEKQKEGRSMMLYGIIAIFVMVSVWGLVGILTGTFGFSNAPINAPKLPTV